MGTILGQNEKSQQRMLNLKFKKFVPQNSTQHVQNNSQYEYHKHCTDCQEIFILVTKETAII